MLRPRTIVYATLIAGLIAGFAYTLTHRNVVARRRASATAMRCSASCPDGLIENVYNVKILNKDSDAHEFSHHRERPARPAGRLRRDRRSRSARATCRASPVPAPRAAQANCRAAPTSQFTIAHAGRARARSDGQGPFPRAHELIGCAHEHTRPSDPGTASSSPGC